MPGETIFKPLQWSDIGVMAPELVLGVWFVLLVVVELLLPKPVSRNWIGWLTLVGFAGAFVLVLLRMLDMNSGDGTEAISLLGDSYRVDDFGSLMKLLVLAGTAIVTLLGLSTVSRDRSITDKGEFFYLLLPAAIGAMMMASSGNLITLYIGLELLTITSYVLVGLRRKSSLSAEAAFKYVVTGGVSSAFILFGMSYLYGVTGSVELSAIREALPAAVGSYEALVYVGFGCMIAGFAIKVAAAPFHAWSLDVYQGSPTPIAAFLAVVSKGATFAMILRVIFSLGLFTGNGSTTGGSVKDDLFFTVLLLAAISMLAGTLAALRQKNAKRLLALSGVANAGYLLVPIGLGVTATHSNNGTELLFYLVAYLLMTMGAFAVQTVVSRSVGHDELRGFAGMYYRSPWTAIAMVMFLLSLAGLPVSAGFFGKLFILLGAANAKAYWIAAIMVLSSVISYYFYFGIIRQMFMRSSNGLIEAGQGEDSAAEQEVSSDEKPDDRPDGTIRVPLTTGIVIWFCASLTFALGIFPGLVVNILDNVFSISGDILG
ncbi:NADH-quinone oxidoreductase subunit N [Paenibacillus nanensis]|uniref:NADH-quinone oxidoreductase subunit N n=1 Tax=Paenibacillus nanensis TaxID=393251 RepID=A0A3A1UUC5_9BACL|nr:NADH-quinone oxidoreductase subunit N [Paenibacillus nanensis]RIX51031.1 NADH-quinone oxidoreductase subunit N [Paenibacillus nanensis]